MVTDPVLVVAAIQLRLHHPHPAQAVAVVLVEEAPGVALVAVPEVAVPAEAAGPICPIAFSRKSDISVQTSRVQAPVPEGAAAVHPSGQNHPPAFQSPSSRPSTYQLRRSMPGPRTGLSSANRLPSGLMQTPATSI